MKNITKTAMMAALVFLLTYTFKIPNVITGGYTHLGDVAIFLSVLILGKKKGAAAGAIGAMLADLLGGYLMWVIPTFVFKAIMAYVCGIFAEDILKNQKNGWIVGAVLGGICQIIGYQTFKWVVISPAAAVSTIITISSQTVIGIVLSVAIVSILQRSHTIERLRAM